MDERRQEALRNHHQALRTGILVENFLPALRPVSSLVLTDVEYVRVSEKEDNIARVDELIRILLTKENRHFDAFCVALERNGYEDWARRLRQEEVNKTEDPALTQLQVQYPIIDELADEFAMVIADVKRELHSLSPNCLQGVKALIEEKLKSKGTRITIPSSADELIDTISKYWDYLSFEFARLVVRYLGKEDLQARLKRYEDDLQKKAEILLTRCRQNRIDPIAPPGSSNMKIKVDADAYSFSLHRILKMKDFLVYQIGMDSALFSGWSDGCITLHFFILGGDMETADRQLKRHEFKLRDMQVMEIEVDGVIVYQDTPNKRQSSIEAISKTIDHIADDMKSGGPMASKLLEVCSRVVVVVENVQAILQEVNIEDIKHILEVKTALRDLKSVVDIAHGFLDDVDNILYCCRSDSESMEAARAGLSHSPPDLKPLRDLFGNLEKSLAGAEAKYSQFVNACDTAMNSCIQAEKVCKHMETDSRNKKDTTKRVGGAVTKTALTGGTVATVGGLVMVGLTLSGFFTFGATSIIAGITGVAVAALGVAGVAGGVGAKLLTDHIASTFAESEATFKQIRGDFGALNSFTSDLQVIAAQVHTTTEHIAAQVDLGKNIDKRSTNMMRDSLQHLNTACEDVWQNLRKEGICEKQDKRAQR